MATPVPMTVHAVASESAAQRAKRADMMASSAVNCMPASQMNWRDIRCSSASNLASTVSNFLSTASNLASTATNRSSMAPKRRSMASKRDAVARYARTLRRR